MAQVRVATTAEQLDPAHAVAEVGALHDAGGFQLGMKAGPPATGIELAVRVEQRQAAANAMIRALLPALIVLTAEGGLGPGQARHTVLLITQ